MALTWRLLQLDHLLVGEDATVVNELETVVGVAVGADGRLGNLASVHLHRSRERAHYALEKGFSHIWHNV